MRFVEEDFDLGGRPPAIQRVEMDPFQSDNELRLEVSFFFYPSSSFPLMVRFLPGLPEVPILLEQFVVRGRARLHLSLNAVAPQLSQITFSLIGEPLVDFRFNLGLADPLAVLLYQWAHKCVLDALNELIWPHEVSFRLQNHVAYLPILSSFLPQHSSRPIVDIGFSVPGESIPEGWELIHRTVTGAYPADLNRGVIEAPEIYLCIRRAPLDGLCDLDPITALCVTPAGASEMSLSWFTPVTRTFGNQQANLNSACPPMDCFLSFSRRPEGNGAS